MSLDDYLQLLDWTGRMVHREFTKRGHIPTNAPPILERLHCTAEMWLDYVQNFRQRFRHEVGLASARQAFRETLKSRRQNSSLSQ